MANEEFLVTYPSNIGEVTFIEVKRKERPPGLRKPYEYILDKQICDAGYSRLRLFFKSQDKQKFQYSDSWKKGLSMGMKFGIFILSHPVGFCGDEKGIRETEWKTFTEKTQELLFSMLGPDARMYIEPFSTDRKFQARFETYVAYTELLP